MSVLVATDVEILSDTRSFEAMLMRNYRVTLWRVGDKYVSNGKKKRKRSSSSAKSCKADSPSSRLGQI